MSDSILDGCIESAGLRDCVMALARSGEKRTHAEAVHGPARAPCSNSFEMLRCSIPNKCTEIDGAMVLYSKTY